MPIYEYQCRSCDQRVEKLQKMSDPPLATCPACGEDELTRLVSAASFRLKGGGWYETDFKKDGRRNLAGDNPPEAKSGNGKSDAKPESAKQSNTESTKESKKDSTKGKGSDNKGADAKPAKSAPASPAP